MNKLFLILAIVFGNIMLSNAQIQTEQVKDTTLKSIQLFPMANQLAFPVVRLNSTEQLELHFDDLKAGYKNYFYTFQLCNSDWTPAMVTYFDYMKGFNNNRITTFRNSNYAQTRYTHYSAVLPEKASTPIKSGNYLLKVYTDSDTSKVAFTKRFVVLDDKVTGAAQMLQPVGQQVYNTHQRVIIRLNTQGLNITNAHQQLKVVVLQNQRWDDVTKNVLPTFIRGRDVEYNTETDFVFPAGREWRWADLRSFRYLTDRMAKSEFTKNGNSIQLKADAERKSLRYTFFRDINGLYTIENVDNINSYWQADYANVKFAFAPPNGEAIAGKDVYLIGKLTNYKLDETSKLKFNNDTKQYETNLTLKQGFYNYQYATANTNDKNKFLDIAPIEGNYWEAENTYQILIYYRPFGARYDELVGYTSASSLNGRVGPGY